MFERPWSREYGCSVPVTSIGKRQGQSLIEATLLVPMVFFLFLGLTNFGFLVYAFITVGNAARVAAQYTANSAFRNNQPVACEVALREMKTLPNISSLSPAYNCTSVSPLLVTVDQNYVEPDTATPATRVTLTYETVKLFRLPFMDGQMTINRTAVMRVMD